MGGYLQLLKLCKMFWMNYASNISSLYSCCNICFDSNTHGSRIIIQRIGNVSKIFLDVAVSFPTSFHDVRAFRISVFVSKEMKRTDSTELNFKCWQPRNLTISGGRYPYLFCLGLKILTQKEQKIL